MEASDAQPAEGTATVLAKKQPPPENPDAIRLRTKVILSFWAVILCLGFPMWWQTTSIYRARLPLQEMLDWSEGKADHISFSLPVCVTAPSVSDAQLNQLLHDTQTTVHLHNGFSAVRTQLYSRASILPQMFEDSLQVELVPRDDASSVGAAFSGDKAILQYPTGDVGSLPDYLGQFLSAIIEEEQVNVARRLAVQFASAEEARHFLNDKGYDLVVAGERRDAKAFKASPNYHITFSLFTAGGSPSSWDIEAALQSHLQPIVVALAATTNFSIATQVQLYSAFSPSIRPLKDESRNGSSLRQEDLSAFINAAEWPLSPSIGSGPTINFILYVPSQDQMPLRIGNSGETAWLIPQWGGISILNPTLVPFPETDVLHVPLHLDRATLEPVFEIFATQLLSLLGVPSPTDHRISLPLSYRVQSHKRLAALSMFLRASSTLGSLARLASHLANIPIPRHVAQLVDNSIARLRKCSQDLRSSDWDSAIIEAKMAFEDSEKAFFDKSMVGQVYFPDEHKVAVYLPLLGPIGVPLLVGLVREVRKFLNARPQPNTSA